MDAYLNLLKQNKEWAESQLKADEHFFSRLADLQTPEFLWIGCSDSRVPANEITNTAPGEIFVHRNVANLVVNTDLNMLSVLKYAVEVLHVKHVIVCGHYGCGGIKASLSNENFGLLNKWLRNIKDVYRIHKNEIESHGNPEGIEDSLVEFNVIEQVHNLAKTSIVQQAWHEHKRPVLHGCVYSLQNGILKDLITMEDANSLDEMYRLHF